MAYGGWRGRFKRFRGRARSWARGPMSYRTRRGLGYSRYKSARRSWLSNRNLMILGALGAALVLWVQWDNIKAKWEAQGGFSGLLGSGGAQG